MNRKLVAILLAIVMISLVILPVYADGKQPPPDPKSAWGNVFDKNGHLLPGITDGGQKVENVNWMPSILGNPIPATFHIYYTPNGDTVVIPNAITEFFMAAHPDESGLNTAANTYGTGLGYLEAILGAAFGGNQIQVNLNGLPQYVTPDQFAQDMINGQTNIWSLPLSSAWNVLSLLYNTSVGDQNLYLLALLYTSDQCENAPGGCDASNLPTPGALTPNPTNPPPISCPPPSVIPGAISYGGSKLSPAYPLVVGQDPNKTGVTLSFHASVAPTIYNYYIQVPIQSCQPGPNGGGNYDCDGDTGHKVITGFRCVEQSRSYPECIASASGSISLSASSRDWILNTLSILYPGTYIHKPYFSFGGSGCSWSGGGAGVQIDDPGIWGISIVGRTSGTPVSAPRGFSGGGSPFDVYLKEVSIIK